MNNKKSSAVTSFNKWGYIFLIPFAVVFIIFQLVPLVSTIYNSLFENYMSGLKHVGPNFVGLANFAKLFTGGDFLIRRFSYPCFSEPGSRIRHSD